MIVGELALAGGGVEEPIGIEADAGDLREPVGQDWQVGVAVGGGRHLVEQRRPFGDGRGEVVDDAPVEAGLPAGLDSCVLPFAGGPGVGGRRAVGGPPMCIRDRTLCHCRESSRPGPNQRAAEPC